MIISLSRKGNTDTVRFKLMFFLLRHVFFISIIIEATIAKQTPYNLALVYNVNELQHIGKAAAFLEFDHFNRP